MTRKISPSLIKIMTGEEIEKEFIPQLTRATKDLFRILEEFLKPGKTPKRELSFALMKEVNEVETFLDDYGASQNKKFFYFRELVASIRWLNIAFFQGLHILARIKNYKLEISNKEKENFIKDLKKNINFYLNSLRNLTEEIKKEASKLGIKKPKSSFSLNVLLPPIQKKILPPDLNENVVKEEIERIFEILVKFLEDSESFNMFVCRVGRDDEISEEVLEKYRSIFNQLESLYDTYVKNTEIENVYTDLKKVRSHIAVTLHLLEIGKALAHFYERHSDEVRKYDTAIKIGKLVNKNKIKESIRKFVLSSALLFTMKGKDLCRKIFSKLGRDANEFIIETKMLILPPVEIKICIKNIFICNLGYWHYRSYMKIFKTMRRKY